MAQKSQGRRTLRFRAEGKLVILSGMRSFHLASHKQKANHYLLLAVVLGAAGLVYLLGNDRIALWDRDEPRFSQAGREMTRGEDFIVPYFNGDYRFDKPILIYWLMTVNNWLLGVGDFAARLGSSVSGVLACGLMYLVGRRLFNRQVGLMGAAILASFPLFMVESKLATADALLAVFMVAALGLWLGMQGGQRRWYWAVLLGLALGLGTLTKGPVIWLFIWAGSMATLLLELRRGRRWGIWLVAASVVGLAGMCWWSGPPKTVQTGAEIAELLAWLGGGFLIIGLPIAGTISLGGNERKGAGWRRLFKSYGLVLLGMVVAGAVFLPWGLAAVIRTNGAYWSEGVGRHVVERTAQSLEGHWGPPGYYLASWIVCAFPWSVLGPVAIWQGWRISKRDRRVAGLLGWVIGPWLVLEVVQTKLVHYVLGCYPAMALLIAVALYQWRNKLSKIMVGKKLGRIALSGLWIIGLVVAVGMTIAVGVLALGPIAELGEGVSGRYRLVLGAGLAGLVVIATALAVRGSLKKGWGRAGVVSGFVGVMICGAIAGGWVAPRIGSYRISRRAAEAAREISPGGTRFVLFGFDEPSVIWYLGADKPVLIVNSVEQLAEIWAKEEKVCAIISKKKMERLKVSGFEPSDVGRWVEGVYLGKWRREELWVGVNKEGLRQRIQKEIQSIRR